MVWLFNLFAWIVLCSWTVDSSSDGAQVKTFAGSSRHNLWLRHVFAASLRAHCWGCTSSVRVQRVGCTAGKCNFNEVGNSPATRCGGDAMRRRWDATAMQQRCDCDATAQMAIRRNRRESGAEIGANPAQKPAQYVKVFPPKIQKDSDTYLSHTAVGICRYFFQNTCT